MKRRRRQKSEDEGTEQATYHGVGRYGWGRADVRETFVSTLGMSLLGALGLSILFALIAAVAGKLTLVGFGRLLLFVGSTAVAGAVYFTLLFVLSGIWVAYKRAHRQQHEEQQPHVKRTSDNDDVEFWWPGH